MSKKQDAKREQRKMMAPMRRPTGRVVGVIGVVAVVGIGMWACLLFWRWYQSPLKEDAARGNVASTGVQFFPHRDAAPAHPVEPDKHLTSEGANHSGHGSAAAVEGESDADADGNAPADSFLDSFTAPDSAGTNGAGEDGDIAGSNQALEKSFRDVLAAMDERTELMARGQAAIEAGDRAALMQLKSQSDALSNRLNGQLDRLQGDLSQARQSRPDDPVVQWLTGELLMQVGGEPNTILPYFQRAVDGGLKRARLFASLARVQLHSNQFAAAYASAVRALEIGPADRFIWEVYDNVARNNQRFDELGQRLDAAFPDAAARPAWVKEIYERLAHVRALWEAEMRLREADEKANDLPRVRFTIEHRRFARDADGNSTTQIETTGRGEVELELFENQAPETVANFISLVEQGFYDGTLFMVAESAAYVHGGDPNTRNGDPSDDGGGGPGYVIPDESQRPDARRHFRGTLTMVNARPHTAGSQFLITLAPFEPFDGHFAAFGRVIKGQEVVDQITQGRTTKQIGRFGRLIPGDVLLKAEVIRKRPHPYVATKQ